MSEIQEQHMPNLYLPLPPINQKSSTLSPKKLKLLNNKINEEINEEVKQEIKQEIKKKTDYDIWSSNKLNNSGICFKIKNIPIITKNNEKGINIMYIRIND
jgi:predicted transglutaminase-like cysteine proteinase